MEIGYGHRYSVSFDNLTIPTSPSAFDLVLFATSSTVPCIVDYADVTAAVTTGAILRLVMQRRSTASTGGTAVTPTPSSPGSPAASTTVTYNNVSTVGSASGIPFNAQQWNEFAPYEFDERPGGELILPGSFFGLYIPVAPGSSVQASFNIQFVEIK